MKPYPFNTWAHALLWPAAALLTVAQMAWALEPFKVQDIRVEACSADQSGTVFASIPVRVGDEYDDEKGTTNHSCLFALGLFKDVRLEANSVCWWWSLKRPTIANVEFVGAKEFDKKALQQSMRDVGLFRGRPFDKALADQGRAAKSSSANTSAAAVRCGSGGYRHPH